MRRKLLAMCLFVLTGTAWAQSSDDRQKCVEERDADLRIHYCTRLIQSGQLTDQDISVAFNNRGDAYYDKKQ